MAESVDALVSNTSGATHPGSIPGLGTETEKVEKLSPFSFLPTRNSLDFKSEGTFTAQGMNQLLEAILSEIEAIYNDRIIDTNNAKVRLTDFNS